MSPPESPRVVGEFLSLAPLPVRAFSMSFGRTLVRNSQTDRSRSKSSLGLRGESRRGRKLSFCQFQKRLKGDFLSRGENLPFRDS